MLELNLRLAAAVLAFGLLAGLPGRVAAHIRVTASTPAANSTVTVPVREIRVTFSQRVSARYTRLSVLNPNGIELAVADLAAVDSAGREYRATLTEPLANGTYRVIWRTAGADGHVVSGEFTFTVAAAVLDTATTAVIVDVEGPAGEPDGRRELVDVNTRPGAVFVRWSNFIALLLALGAVAFGTLVLPNIQSNSVPDSYWSMLNTGLRRAAILSAFLVLLASVPRFLLQSALLHGSESMFEPGRVRVLLVDTAWGIGWLLQLVAGLGLLLAAWLRARSLAWAGAIALALSAALSGHAAGVERMATVAVVSDMLHVLAAASWIGTLAIIVTLVLPLTFRQSGNALTGLAAVIRAFSPVALIAAAVIVLTGVSAALIQLTHISQLWSSAYGRALLIKLGLVAVVAGLGYYNNSRLRPRLGEPEPTAQLRKSAGLELTFGALVLLVTAVLVALPTPH
ncbi:MAG: copper resistance CopC/CopD family protein [Pseudomonas sp.]